MPAQLKTLAAIASVLVITEAASADDADPRTEHFLGMPDDEWRKMEDQNPQTAQGLKKEGRITKQEYHRNGTVQSADPGGQCGAAAAADESSTSEIDGTWRILTNESKSGRVSEQENRRWNYRLVIRDGKATWKSKRIGHELVSVRIDSSAEPKELDFLLNGRVLNKCIYELVRDQMRLCIGHFGEDRPTAFTVGPESDVSLLVMKRRTDVGDHRRKGRRAGSCCPARDCRGASGREPDGGAQGERPPQRANDSSGREVQDAPAARI